VLTFGRSPAADVRATGVTTAGGRASFVLEAEQGTATVSLTLVGEHHVEGALAAAAVALSCGCPLAEVAAGLSAATARSRWRMEVTERPDGVTVVNDAYNANPESMAAALRATVELAGGRRTWAVLGEMRELGPSATAEHEQLGRLAVRLGVRRLLVVGEGARTVHLGAGLEGAAGDRSVLVPDVGAAIAVLDAEVEPGDVVLVKASRAAGLERVAEALLEEVTA
jgi:UDP-N-acetylmuramoyl-tripeptide--D-alanyl-D-alanine ligase